MTAPGADASGPTASGADASGPTAPGPSPSDRELPAGRYRLPAFHNWLLHDALYSEPGPEAHPLAAFVAAQRGTGLTVAELFASFGARIEDGPRLAGCDLDLHRAFAVDVDHTVRGWVEPAVRRSGRALGVFDLVRCRYAVASSDGPVADVVVHYAVPRGGEGAVLRGGEGAVPRDGEGAVLRGREGPPPEAVRRAPDAASAPPEVVPPGAVPPVPAGAEFAWGPCTIDPGRMKVLALLLDDANPLHFDPAATARLGLGDRPLSQGPTGLAMIVTMLRATFPGSRVRHLSARLLAPVFAGDTVRCAGRAAGDRSDRAADGAAYDVWLEGADGRVAVRGRACLHPAGPT